MLFDRVIDYFNTCSARFSLFHFVDPMFTSLNNQFIVTLIYFSQHTGLTLVRFLPDALNDGGQAVVEISCTNLTTLSRESSRVM